MEAVAAGWTSVTPLGLRSDLLFKVGTRARRVRCAWHGAGEGGQNTRWRRTLALTATWRPSKAPVPHPTPPQTRNGAANSGESALQERHARGSVAVAAQVVTRASAALGTGAAGVEGIEWPVVD